MESLHGEGCFGIGLVSQIAQMFESFSNDNMSLEEGLPLVHFTYDGCSKWFMPDVVDV